MFDYTLILTTVFTSCTWLVIWLHSFKMDKSIKGKLPVDARLVFFSSTLIFLISIFYTLMYVQISFALSGLFNLPHSSFFGILFSLASTVFGAYLVIESRLELSNLTSKEIIFSLNTKQVKTGIYRYMNHPMYVGIMLILIGSLINLPSLINVLIFIPILICLYAKARIEVNSN